MPDEYRNRRATVECVGCGSRRIVAIWSVGMIEPLDGDALCSCDEADLRIVSSADDTPAPGDGRR